MSVVSKFEGDWRAAKGHIESQIDRIQIAGPNEIQKTRWGIIEGGAGTGGQSFSVLVHLEAYLMLVGADVTYRFMKVSQYDDMSVATVIRMTREFPTGTFNVFVFMMDLGLTDMHQMGTIYGKALNGLGCKDEYVQLTGAMMAYVIRMCRWIHYVFPWNLGVTFPHHKPAEIAAIAAIAGAAMPGAA